MKTLLSTFVSCLFLNGCDYVEMYEYSITNLTDQVIRIETDSKNSWELEVLDKGDSIFQIKPSETLKIKSQLGGICGRYEIPVSEYTVTDSVPSSEFKFDIYVGNILIPKDIRVYKNWNYSTKERLGTYNLRITKESLTE